MTTAKRGPAKGSRKWKRMSRRQPRLRSFCLTWKNAHPDDGGGYNVAMYLGEGKWWRMDGFEYEGASHWWPVQLPPH
jgi:hypothetical protein